MVCPRFHFSYYVGSCHYCAILIQSESVAKTIHRKSTFDTDISQLYKQQVKKHIRFLYNEKEDKDKSFCLFIKESILFLFSYSLIINLLQVMTIISYHFLVFIFIYFIIFHFILSFISWWQLELCITSVLASVQHYTSLRAFYYCSDIKHYFSLKLKKKTLLSPNIK